MQRKTLIAHQAWEYISTLAICSAAHKEQLIFYFILSFEGRFCFVTQLQKGLYYLFFFFNLPLHLALFFSTFFTCALLSPFLSFLACAFPLFWPLLSSESFCILASCELGAFVCPLCAALPAVTLRRGHSASLPA